MPYRNRFAYAVPPTAAAPLAAPTLPTVPAPVPYAIAMPPVSLAPGERGESVIYAADRPVTPIHLSIRETGGPSDLVGFYVGQRDQLWTLDEDFEIPIMAEGSAAVAVRLFHYTGIALVGYETAQRGNSITLVFRNRGAFTIIRPVITLVPGVPQAPARLPPLRARTSG